MDLLTLNPWWNEKEAIGLDKHLISLKDLEFVHEPSILNVEFKKGSLYTVRGPRQIGKTTLLKMLIKKMLQGIPAKNIFYWSCDNLMNGTELIDLLKDYSDHCKLEGAEPDYILLDEITGIKEWQKAIKFVIDNNITGNACYILTGSSSMDLKKGTERLPGRRGRHGKDLFLLPLTFREFVGLVDPEWHSKNKGKSGKALSYNDDRLKMHFKRYLKTGGVPLVINEYLETGHIPPYLHDLYYSWIVGDVLKEGKSEQNLKEFMKGLLISYTTPISWDSLAKRSSIKSHITIASYVEVLENIFALFPCYFFDINQKKIEFRKNKKIYFYDPFILTIFMERLNIKVEIEKVIEGMVGSHLKRPSIMKYLCYTKIKKETDFVLDEDHGIEVKYQNRIIRSDFNNRKYFKEFLILSKDTMEKDVIPVHIYLYTMYDDMDILTIEKKNEQYLWG